MKVIFQMLDETEKVFEDVTKIKGNVALDECTNTIEVFQGKKKTKIKQYKINDFEIIQ